MSIDEDTAKSVNTFFTRVKGVLQNHVQDLTKLADEISDKAAEVSAATVKAADTIAPVVEAAVPVASPEVGLAKEVLDGIAEEIAKLHAKFDSLTGATPAEATEPNSEAEATAITEPDAVTETTVVADPTPESTTAS